MNQLYLDKMMEHNKMMQERRWRKNMRLLGYSMEEVMGDLPQRVSMLNVETNEVRDRKRAEEAERIRRDNLAHQERLANMRPAIDDDTEDDATGAARARLRAQAAARRQAETASIRAANAAMRARIRNIQAATDNKIWDDGAGSAGAARDVYAQRSRVRKAAEAQRLEAENNTYSKRISSVVAATDDGDGIQF